MKEYKCMNCLTSFEAEYKENCPSCDDDIDVIELPTSGNVMISEKDYDKLQKLALSATTDKISVEKLQEQLKTAKKALTEIVFFSQGCYPQEYFASIAQKALAAIGGDDE